MLGPLLTIPVQSMVRLAQHHSPCHGHQCVCVCVSVLLFCDQTLGAATYHSVIMAMSVRRHTKVFAIGEG